MLFFRDNIVGIAATYSLGKNHRPDGLSLGSAIWTRDSRNRDSDISTAALHHPARHRPRRGDRHRTECLDNVGTDPEQRDFRFIGIGNDAGEQHIRRTGNFGQRRADEPASAAFGDRNRPSGGTVGLDHAACGIDQHVGQQVIAVRTGTGFSRFVHISSGIRTVAMA